MCRDAILRGWGRAQVECPQSLRCATPQRSDERAVVVVRDLAGAMVELELLQCGERTVALLCERQSSLLQFVRSDQTVVPRRRLAQERPGDHCHAEDGKHHPD